MSVDLSQLKALGDRFDAMPAVANEALNSGMRSAMASLAVYIQGNKLSGQVLNVRSGRLRDSITPSVDQNGDVTSGTVGSDLPYAAIQEYGGTILRSRVKSYRINEPERSYLRSALADRSAAIQTQLTAALLEAIA